MTRLDKITRLMERLAEQQRRHGPTKVIQSELYATRNRDLIAYVREQKRLSRERSAA